jgi:hypothetical protein
MGADDLVRDALTIPCSARPAGELTTVARIAEQSTLGVPGQPQQADGLLVVREMQDRAL